MNLLLIALALQVPPEDVQRRVRELVEQLQSDVVEERERALERLVALGDPALPALERAKLSSDPDEVRRIEAAVREIGRGGRLRAVRPPVRQLTLDLKTGTRAEAAVQAMTAVGVEVSMRPGRSRADGPGRLSVRAAAAWEILDAIDAQLGLRGPPSAFFSGSAVRPELGDDVPLDESVRWTTLGDLRVFVRPGVLKTATGEDCPYFEFAVALHPQTFALDLELDGLSSDGKPLSLSSEPRRLRAGDLPPLRRPGSFNVGDNRVTSLDPHVLKGKDRISLKGNLVLIFPRDVERVEFDEGARAAPVQRKSEGVTFAYHFGQSTEPESDTFLGWTNESALRERFLALYENGGRWQRDERILTIEPGTGRLFWNSGRQRITLLRLIGREKVTLPFEIRDVPVPAAAGR